MAAKSRLKKFEIKSESWLDLSQINRQEQQQQLDRRTEGSSSSICGAGDNPKEAAAAAAASSQKQQQHLLIRLRQQSYLNRSSTTIDSSSSATNLSNSIDLSSLTGGRQQQQQQPAARENNLLKKEPTRLRYLRDKFHKKKHYFGGAAADLLSREASPSTRSLSGSINEKFQHFRHSWKHFLYKYSNHSLNTIEQQQQQRQAKSYSQDQLILGWQEEQEVNRLRMTGDWIERHLNSNQHHHHSHGDDRPKSLEILSPSLSNRQRRQLHYANGRNLNNNDNTDAECYFRGQSQPPPVRQFDRCWLRPSSREFASNEDGVSKRMSQQQQLKSIKQSSNNTLDSSSSTTLVSDTQQQQLPVPAQSGAAGSESPAFSSGDSQQNSTLSRSSSSISNSCYPEATTNKNKRPSSHEKLEANKQKVRMNHQQQQLRQGQRLLPPVPSLLFDGHHEQEYYFDVAQTKLANSQAGHHHHHHQQQQQLQQFPLPTAATANLSNLVHTNISAADFGFQPQQPASRMFSTAAGARLEFDQMTEYDDEDYAMPADESNYRLERQQVELVQLIGEGQKGYVFLGKLQAKTGARFEDVAIKTLKYETPQLIDWLMREAAMMRQLEHPHIIRFIGVCPDTPALIAMELAELGELKQYLKLNQHSMVNSQLILFTFQISTALSYLESKQLVHRDVAARNVLVCGPNCVKLADFGLTRNLLASSPLNHPPHSHHHHLFNHHDELMTNDDQDDGNQQYVAAARGKLPLRWLAPESLAFRRFTSASDVWMFAVCSWEMFHFGQQRPWAHLRNQQLLAAIESGQRLARPPNCPARFYQLLLQCWSYAPIQRPKFRELKQTIWSIYLNERAKEQLKLEQPAAAAAAALASRLAGPRVAPPGGRARNQQLASQQQQQSQADFLLGGACWSPLNLSYGSNVSGYSSGAATAADLSNPTSHNSSRCSSMGSLARRQQLKQQQQQVTQAGRLLQWPAPPLQGCKSPVELANSEQEDELEELDRMKGQSRVKASSPMGGSKFETDVQENMRRFRPRAGGHLLQKQRSQGSIVASNFAAGRPIIQVRGYDDAALLGGGGGGGGISVYNNSASQLGIANRGRRPLSSQSNGGGGFRNEDEDYEEDYDEQESADDDDDDDDAELKQRRREQQRRRCHSRQRKGGRLGIQELRAAAAAAAAPPGKRESPSPLQLERQVAAKKQQQHHRPNKEVAMIRGDLSVRLPVHSIEQPQRPQQPGADERQLSSVLESMRLTPMKARLLASEGARLQSAAAAPIEHEEQLQQQQQRQRQQEAELRQLALHQRLLGHIRPASRATGSGVAGDQRRRSMNMERPVAAGSIVGQQPQQQQQQQQQQQNPAAALDGQGVSSVETTVDQSLLILESLISEKGFAAGQTAAAAAAAAVSKCQQQQQQQPLSGGAASKRNPQPTAKAAAQQFVDFFVRRK